MLKRDSRVPKKLFPFLRKNVLHEGEFFSIRVTFGVPGAESPKCICIVSKKIAKQAVKRNKIKRQVYSIIYSRLRNANKKSVLQIFPKTNSLDYDFQNLKIDLENIIQKNNLL